MVHGGGARLPKTQQPERLAAALPGNGGAQVHLGIGPGGAPVHAGSGADNAPAVLADRGHATSPGPRGSSRIAAVRISKPVPAGQARLAPSGRAARGKA
jgi:hypothetical protein